jgi:hypothetical protein
MLLAKRQILVNLGIENAITRVLRMMLCSSLSGDHSSNHHNTLLVLDGITGKARPLEARKPWFV